MKTIERVMRVMTHVNIGATLGTAAWIVWSGLQVVGGEWPVTPRPTAPATSATEISCCFVPADRGQPALQVRTGSPERIARIEDGAP